MAKETNSEKQLRYNVAQRIKEVREGKGISQCDLARDMDVTQGLVSQYENGNSPVQLMTVLDICDVLGCSVDYLMGREVHHEVTTIGRMVDAFSSLKVDDQQLLIVMTEAAAGRV